MSTSIYFVSRPQTIDEELWYNEFSKQLHDSQRVIALTIHIEDDFLEQLRKAEILAASEYKNIISFRHKSWQTRQFLSVIKLKPPYCIKKISQLFENFGQKFIANLLHRTFISVNSALNLICDSTKVNALPIDLVCNESTGNIDQQIGLETTLSQNENIVYLLQQDIDALWTEYRQHKILIQSMAETSVSVEYIQAILIEVKKQGNYLEKQGADMLELFDKCKDLDYKMLKIRQHCNAIDNSIIQIKKIQIPEMDCLLLTQEVKKELKLLTDIKKSYEKFAEKLNLSRSFKWTPNEG